MNRPKPIRVLHIVGGMVRGGIETWLMHILRHRDADRFAMDFIVHTAEPCPYDDELRQLGGRIHPCLTPLRPWQYARNFARIAAEAGPFDIVHSHVHQFNGFTLRAARQAGVPVRIAHSHVGTMPEDVAPGLARRLYGRTMRHLISRHATLGFAASEFAADTLFPAGWASDPRFRLLLYGIDTQPFHAGPDASVREELGLPGDAFVVCHIGRFEEQKNHAFLVEIAQELIALEPRTHFLLIGGGALRGAIEQRVRDLGLIERVHFAGLRPDVPRVLRSAADAFVLPSLCEGLGIVLIEAQAAGRPCVITDSIPHEVGVVPDLIVRRSLAEPASAWAASLLALHRHPPAVTPAEALAAVERSPFTIRRSVAELQSAYAAAVGA